MFETAKLKSILLINNEETGYRLEIARMGWPESIALMTRVTCFTVIVTSPAWMFAVYFIFRG